MVIGVTPFKCSFMNICAPVGSVSKTTNSVSFSEEILLSLVFPMPVNVSLYTCDGFINVGIANSKGIYDSLIIFNCFSFGET